MSDKIWFERVMEFGIQLYELRRAFPEFKREIDRFHFDIGKRFISCCEHPECGCQMSFEDFHDQQNRFFNAESDAYLNEQIEKLGWCSVGNT